MKTMKKLLAVLLALVMVMATLAACGGNKETEPSKDTEPAGTQGTEPVETEPGLANAERYGGHLRIATYSGLHIDPSKAGHWHYVWNLGVYEPFLSRDAEGVIRPGVCDFELSDDMLTLKLTVRPDKFFHNGDIVDIEDVKASLERNCYGGVHNNSKKFIGAYIGSMEIEGDSLTIKFTEYNEKTWLYLASWQTYNVAIPKEICEKYPDSKITEIPDAIGTGPYKIVDWAENQFIALEKFADYIPDENGYSGLAGPKYGYLDSLTYYANGDQNSQVMGLLSNDYDAISYLPLDYYETAQAEGFVNTYSGFDQGCAYVFNCYGPGPCAKYPDLRKAIMAAIDYQELVTQLDGSENFELCGNPVIGSAYETDVFENMDYFGAQNLEVAAKYIEAAKAAGWDPETEKVQLVLSSGDSAEAVMMQKYLNDAGIPFDFVIKDGGSYSEFVAEPSNAWDFKWRSPTFNTTPVILAPEWMNTFDPDPKKVELLAKMNTLTEGSAEYLACWEELSVVMAEGCAVPILAKLNWVWTHKAGLVINDDNVHKYFFNAYWENPAEHPAP